METTKKDNENDLSYGQLKELFAGLASILLIIGVIFGTLKWKSITLCPNEEGGFNTKISTWWGLDKDERSYSFNGDTQEWEITIKGDKKLKL